MNHLGTVQLETERLILRRFMLDDDKQMFANPAILRSWDENWTELSVD